MTDEQSVWTKFPKSEGPRWYNFRTGTYDLTERPTDETIADYLPQTPKAPAIYRLYRIGGLSMLDAMLNVLMEGLGKEPPHKPVWTEPKPLAAPIPGLKLIVADNENTKELGIRGMRAYIQEEVAPHTYSCLVRDQDGMPAGPYTLTWSDLEIVSAGAGTSICTAQALTDAIQAASPGDAIVVCSEAMRELGERAAERMGKEGIVFEVQSQAEEA